MIEFGREICGNPDLAAQREWLVTNGIGGYASGTISGEITRRYQGLLVSALHPPVARKLFVARIDETVTYDGETYDLATHRVDPHTLSSHGYRFLERFHLDGSIPAWTFALGDALLEKRIWMERHENTTYVQYRVIRASCPVNLHLVPLVSSRSSHDINTDTDWSISVETTDDGLQYQAGDDGVPFEVLIDGAEADTDQEWSTPAYLYIDDERGIHPHESYIRGGNLSVTLEEGDKTILVATSEQGRPDTSGALERRQELDASITGGSKVETDNSGIRQLVLAADQFLVRREFEDEPGGRSIIAGYHWFEDWGRDTMIALPGLTLATGRQDEARKIILTYAAAIDKGMLPNRFPEDGSKPVYNTIDATPWFFEAIRAYVADTNDDGLLRDIFPVLVDIIDWHERGTRYDIRFDPDDGLVGCGPEGAPLSWMDARMGDFVPTPRVGKPVEVNALWYNALCSIVEFADRIGEDGTRFSRLAERLQTGFQRFWNDDLNYCFDVLDGPDGDDPALRPNQVFAVSVEHSPLSEAQQRAVVDVCGRKLLTSHGLRSLAPDDDEYIGYYAGDLRDRDGAYHQGTVWSWLIGPYASAHFRIHNDRQAARDLLHPLILHLSDHGIGSISEVFDAEPPFFGRGCIAQAWGVAEILRVWHQTS